jgi:hypothetical protein
MIVYCNNVKQNSHVRFEVSTAVTMMSLLFRSVPARLVHPEDGGDTILRNIGSYKSHTTSSPRRW